MKQIVEKKIPEEILQDLFDEKALLFWASRVSDTCDGDFRIASAFLKKCIDSAESMSSKITLKLVQTVFTDVRSRDNAIVQSLSPFCKILFDLLNENCPNGEFTEEIARKLYCKKLALDRPEPGAIRQMLDILCDTPFVSV